MHFNFVAESYGRVPNVFLGKSVKGAPADKTVEMGPCQEPEERRIFASLTVMEDLEMDAYTQKDNHPPGGAEREHGAFHNARMDDELKDLVFNRTKTCDGCGYCIQTDKTGKRKRLGLPLRLKDETGVKCPLFPSFTWGNADESVIGHVKKLFDFAEEIIHSGPYGTKQTGPGT